MEFPVNLKPGDKALVTCDNWFLAPDGMEYRAVFGTVRAARTAEDTLGVRPNGRSTNWYLEVGNMTIAGCQVHYIVKTATCNLTAASIWTQHEGRSVVDLAPSRIYGADREGA